jgi:uncharacterized protein
MLYAAFVLGFVGSLHCVFMCGPLLMALPVNRRLVTARLVYHTGRLLTYTLLGSVAGLLVTLAGWVVPQRYFSIGLGVLLLLLLVSKWVDTSPTWPVRVVQRVKSRFFRVVRPHQLTGQFVMGSLNGLLPCGLVYSALAASVLTDSRVEGAVFMLVFGIGTLPALLGLTLLNLRFRFPLHKFQTATYVVVAVVLIFRGVSGTPATSKTHTTAGDSIPVCRSLGH